MFVCYSQCLGMVYWKKYDGEWQCQHNIWTSYMSSLLAKGLWSTLLLYNPWVVEEHTCVLQNVLWSIPCVTKMLIQNDTGSCDHLTLKSLYIEYILHYIIFNNKHVRWISVMYEKKCFYCSKVYIFLHRQITSCWRWFFVTGVSH